MTNKLKILHFPGLVTSFNPDWMNWLDPYLELVPYDSNTAYPRGTLFYIKDTEAHQYNTDLLLNQGFKILYDNLWEVLAPPDFPSHVMHNQNWFWYYESIWYTHLGLDQYQPARTYEYLALMPMRLDRPHRTRLMLQLRPKLDQMIWSYVAHGRSLPNDVPADDCTMQRHFDPDWYNRTHYSIVAESCVHRNESQPVFITEKTYKAMAFQHPFIIYGNAHTLIELQAQGFATYDNLWNEQYDHVQDPIERCRAVVDVVQGIVPEPHSALTLEKIAHNRERFFDSALVRSRIVNEIINPIFEYAETP